MQLFVTCGNGDAIYCVTDFISDAGILSYPEEQSFLKSSFVDRF